MALGEGLRRVAKVGADCAGLSRDLPSCSYIPPHLCLHQNQALVVRHAACVEGYLSVDFVGVAGA